MVHNLPWELRLKINTQFIRKELVTFQSEHTDKGFPHGWCYLNEYVKILCPQTGE